MNVDLRRGGLARLVLLAVTLQHCSAGAMDLFGVDRGLPPSPADSTLINQTGHACAFAALPASPLSFDEAVERALCANPRTSESWSSIRVQAARLGISKAAWLPTLSMTLERDADDTDTSVLAARQLNSSGLQLSNAQELVFNWTILDPGRGFDVASSESTLEASKANHADVLLSVFSDLSRDYFAAQSAAAALSSAIELRGTAQSSYKAARGRADSGVAPISDALQAQTALAESELAVSRAQGELRSATGSLAWRMGLRPDSLLTLPALDERALVAPPTLESIELLITRVQDEHPHALQAARQLDAARSRAQQARAEQMPKLSLSMRMGHDSKPVTAFTGSEPLDARSRYRTATLSISVPIFEGFASNYRIDQAERAIEVSRAQLEEARQQVGNDAWLAWQTMQTAYSTFQQSQQLLSTASESFTAANERYRAGVGSIADLLSAQSALTNADNRKRLALSDWRSANAALWSKLGQIRTN